jgi:hypothetical protein
VVAAGKLDGAAAPGYGFSPSFFFYFSSLVSLLFLSLFFSSILPLYSSFFFLFLPCFFSFSPLFVFCSSISSSLFLFFTAPPSFLLFFSLYL